MQRVCLPLDRKNEGWRGCEDALPGESVACPRALIDRSIFRIDSTGSVRSRDRRGTLAAREPRRRDGRSSMGGYGFVRTYTFVRWLVVRATGGARGDRHDRLDDRYDLAARRAR